MKRSFWFMDLMLGFIPKVRISSGVAKVPEPS